MIFYHFSGRIGSKLFIIIYRTITGKKNPSEALASEGFFHYYILLLIICFKGFRCRIRGIGRTVGIILRDRVIRL